MSYIRLASTFSDILVWYDYHQSSLGSATVSYRIWGAPYGAPHPRHRADPGGLGSFKYK